MIRRLRFAPERKPPFSPVESRSQARRGAVVLAAAMLSSLSSPAGLLARQADAAVVEDILDGPVLYIERRQAHLREKAFVRGPLFQGFSAPLPARPARETFLHRRFPAEFPATARESLSGDPLVERINRIRERRGRPALQPLPQVLAARNAAYLAPLLQGILDSTGCDHDRSRWQAFQNRMASTAKLMPTSEVIACPMPAGSWDPERVVSRWMGSPLHTRILIDRPRARAIDCVRLVRSGRAAAICTLWSPAAAGSP